MTYFFEKPPLTSKPLFDYKHSTLEFPKKKLTPLPSLYNLFSNAKYYSTTTNDYTN